MDARTEGEFLSMARAAYPREAVAFLVVNRGRFRLMAAENVSTKPEESVVTTPADWEAAERLGEIVAVLHSHPDAEAAPSPLDQSAAGASGVDWLICGLPDGPDGRVDWARIPRGPRPPLVGRQFVHGVADCWSIVRDWYLEERGVSLPDFHRADEWWKRGQRLYEDHYREAGFYCVARGTAAAGVLEVGDFLLFHIDSNVPNHAAVYLGDGQILHHLAGRLSSRDTLSGFYLERLTHVLRYGQPHD